MRNRYKEVRWKSLIAFVVIAAVLTGVLWLISQGEPNWAIVLGLSFLGVFTALVTHANDFIERFVIRRDKRAKTLCDDYLNDLERFLCSTYLAPLGTSVDFTTRSGWKIRFVHRSMPKKDRSTNKGESASNDAEGQPDRLEDEVSGTFGHRDVEIIGQVADTHKLLARSPKSVLLGDSGSGKSTALAYLCLQRCHEARKSPTAPLPVFIDISGIEESSPEKAIRQCLDRMCGIEGRVTETIPQPGGDVYFDGLIGEENTRRQVHFIIDNFDFVTQPAEFAHYFIFPRNRWVTLSASTGNWALLSESITDRSILTAIGIILLRPFSGDHIRRRFAQEGVKLPVGAATTSGVMNRVYALLGNPRMLALAIEVLRNRNRIDRESPMQASESFSPAALIDLWVAKALNAQFFSDQRQQTILAFRATYLSLSRGLARLAYEMTKDHVNAVDSMSAIMWMEQECNVDALPDSAYLETAQRLGLLKGNSLPPNMRAGFAFREMRTYFAARYLIENPDGSSILRDLPEQYGSSDVIVMIFDLLVSWSDPRLERCWDELMQDMHSSKRRLIIARVISTDPVRFRDVLVDRFIPELAPDLNWAKSRSFERGSIASECLTTIGSFDAVSALVDTIAKGGYSGDALARYARNGDRRFAPTYVASRYGAYFTHDYEVFRAIQSTCSEASEFSISLHKRRQPVSDLRHRSVEMLTRVAKEERWHNWMLFGGLIAANLTFGIPLLVLKVVQHAIYPGISATTTDHHRIIFDFVTDLRCREPLSREVTQVLRWISRYQFLNMVLNEDSVRYSSLVRKYYFRELAKLKARRLRLKLFLRYSRFAQNTLSVARSVFLFPFRMARVILILCVSCIIVLAITGYDVATIDLILSSGVMPSSINLGLLEWQVFATNTRLLAIAYASFATLILVVFVPEYGDFLGWIVRPVGYTIEKLGLWLWTSRGLWRSIDQFLTFVAALRRIEPQILGWPHLFVVARGRPGDESVSVLIRQAETCGATRIRLNAISMMEYLQSPRDAFTALMVLLDTKECLVKCEAIRVMAKVVAQYGSKLGTECTSEAMKKLRDIWLQDQRMVVRVYLAQAYAKLNDSEAVQLMITAVGSRSTRDQRQLKPMSREAPVRESSWRDWVCLTTQEFRAAAESSEFSNTALASASIQNQLLLAVNGNIVRSLLTFASRGNAPALRYAEKQIRIPWSEIMWIKYSSLPELIMSWESNYYPSRDSLKLQDVLEALVTGGDQQTLQYMHKRLATIDYLEVRDGRALASATDKLSARIAHTAF